MNRKGSITIFFSLILMVMISFLCNLLLAAKITAGRAHVANAVDQAMFSAMAKYDRALFEEYHLLYIDGGFGTDTLQLGKAYDEIQLDLSYLLTPNKEKEITGGKNFLQLEKVGGSICGYTLATDCNGSVFWEQVVSYMEDTLGLQGISLLSQKQRQEEEIIRGQADSYEDMEEKGVPGEYDAIKQEAKRREEAEKQKKEQVKESAEQDPALVKETKSIIESLLSLKKLSLLNLVLPNPEDISTWSGQWDDLYRNQERKTGMGYLELVRNDNRLTDDLLFHEYILQNFNHYGSKLHAGGPAYAVEWVLSGKTSDKENLETTINRLISMRETANVASLCIDSSRMTEVKMMASALAAGFGLPYVQPVLEGILVLLWAFAESIVDVSGLLDGKEVSLIKNPAGWQVEFSEIPAAVKNPKGFFAGGSGISYKGYLRILLAAENKEEKIERCMEVIEQSMRGIQGKEHFSMDCAIDALETEFRVRIQDRVTCTITEKRCYRTM